jgi:hypothetical protein
VIFNDLQRGNDELLLLAGGVDVAQKEDLQMAAGERKDAAGIIAFRVRLLLLLVGGLPGRFAGIERLLRDCGLDLGRWLLSGGVYTCLDFVHLLLWNEVVRGV